MKKTLLALIPILVFESSLAASSGNLLIEGTVTAVNDITITPNPNATNLDIVAGETNKLVVSVSETSNNLSGYQIKMSSANAGKLIHSTDNTKMTDYTVSYDGASAVALSATEQTVKTVSSLSGLTTVSSDVTVSVTAYPTAPAGVYQDTITIAIVAN
jgi:hypothetical protein